MLVAHRDPHERKRQGIIASDLDVWRQKSGVGLGFAGRELGAEVGRTGFRRLRWRAAETALGPHDPPEFRDFGSD